MIIVSDTSTVSNLRQLNLPHQLYGEIVIPPSVYDEILNLQNFDIDLTEFKKHAWIKIQAPLNSNFVKQVLQALADGAGFWIGKELYNEILKSSNEQ